MARPSGNDERRTMEKRIELAWDEAIAHRARMIEAQHALADVEETAKMDNLDEWVGAKNNDVRRAIVLRALADDVEYHEARVAYRNEKDAFKLAMLHIERLRMLIAAS